MCFVMMEFLKLTIHHLRYDQVVLVFKIHNPSFTMRRMQFRYRTNRIVNIRGLQQAVHFVWQVFLRARLYQVYKPTFGGVQSTAQTAILFKRCHIKILIVLPLHIGSIFKILKKCTHYLSPNINTYITFISYPFATGHSLGWTWL